jgi:hypothetical protein
MALTSCLDCGNSVSSEALACPKCGRPARVARPAVRRNLSRTAAGLLALLLGGIGVHRFYLARLGSGILYVLFCWTFIPALVGLLEGIVLLSMSDQRFVEKYCLA